MAFSMLLCDFIYGSTQVYLREHASVARERQGPLESALGLRIQDDPT